MNTKYNSTNTTMRYSKFTNVLENMFNKVSSNNTNGGELNILKKDINKATFEIEEELYKVIPNGAKFRKEFLKKEMSKSIRGKEAMMVTLADDVITKLKKKQSQMVFPSPRKSMLDSIKRTSITTLKNSLDTALTSHIESPDNNTINSPVKLPKVAEIAPPISPNKPVNVRRSSILSKIVNQHRQSIPNSVIGPSDKNDLLTIKNAFNNITKDVKEVLRMPRMSICTASLNFNHQNKVAEHLMRDHGVGLSSVNVANRNHELIEKYMHEKNEKKIKEMEDKDDMFYQEKFGHRPINTSENDDLDILRVLQDIKNVLYYNKEKNKGKG
jgi:hypothetical protein